MTRLERNGLSPLDFVLLAFFLFLVHFSFFCFVFCGRGFESLNVDRFTDKANNRGGTAHCGRPYLESMQLCPLLLFFFLLLLFLSRCVLTFSAPTEAQRWGVEEQQGQLVSLCSRRCPFRRDAALLPTPPLPKLNHHHGALSARRPPVKCMGHLRTKNARDFNKHVGEGKQVPPRVPNQTSN